LIGVCRGSGYTCDIVLQIKDLYLLAIERTLRQFEAKIGPFVLIQRPPAPVLAKVAHQLGQGRTVGAVHRSRLGDEILAMLVGFKFLQVASLPKLDGPKSLVIGRLPDCNVVVEEPSVSKRHAMLRWDDRAGCSYLSDLGSLNGTFVNVRQIEGEEIALSDGDTLTFGDTPFLYMVSGSLHQQLMSCGYEESF